MPRALAHFLTIPMLAIAAPASAQHPWPAQRSETATLTDMKFADGQILPGLKIRYTTIGTLRRDAKGKAVNAVLLLHSTSGVGSNWLKTETADPLFGPGKPLDASRYYIVIPDGIGRGGSSKPSDGLKGAFPHYRYRDMVAANYRLLTETLGVDHLRLVLGVSMGGMQSWMWATLYPDYMDGAVPLVSQPVALSGRNWMMRQVTINAIRSDPDWHDGNYTKNPTLWTVTAPALTMMLESAANLQKLAPNPATGRALVLKYQQEAAETDANDVLWGREAAEDYNPAPDIGRIRTRLLAINFEDDDVNVADLGTTAAAMRHIPTGKYVLVPAGATHGHLSYVNSELWTPYLRAFLKNLPYR